MLPDNEIRELHGPVTLILYFIVHVVSPAAVVALNYAVYEAPVTSIRVLPSKPLTSMVAITSRAQVAGRV